MSWDQICKFEHELARSFFSFVCHSTFLLRAIKNSALACSAGSFCVLRWKKEQYNKSQKSIILIRWLLVNYWFFFSAPVRRSTSSSSGLRNGNGATSRLERNETRTLKNEKKNRRVSGFETSAIEQMNSAKIFTLILTLWRRRDEHHRS